MADSKQRAHVAGQQPPRGRARGTGACRRRSSSFTRGISYNTIDQPQEHPQPRGRPSSTEILDCNPIEIHPPEEIVLPSRNVEPDWQFEARSRKKPRRPETWKCHTRTLKRRDYSPCQCKRQCGSLFAEGEVEKIREHFFSMREYSQEQNFLFGMIRMVEAKRPTEGTRAQFQFIVHGLRPQDGTEETSTRDIQVCQKQFLNMFSMNADRLKKLQKEKKSGFLSPAADRRGKHDNRPHRIEPSLEVKVMEYIINFIRIHGQKSHFLRRHSANSIYISHTFSPRQLWTSFLSLHQQEYLDAEARREEKRIQHNIKPIVSLKWFAELFRSKFGFVKFRTPKTDECGECLAFRTQLTALKKEDPNNPVIPAVGSTNKASISNRDCC